MGDLKDIKQAELRAWIKKRLLEKKIPRRHLQEKLNVSKTILSRALSDKHESEITYRPFFDFEKEILIEFFPEIPQEIVDKTYFPQPKRQKSGKTASKKDIKIAKQAAQQEQQLVACTNDCSINDWPAVRILGFVRAVTSGKQEVMRANSLLGPNIESIKVPLRYDAENLVAFRVIDHCMQPLVSEGNFIICYKKQRKTTEALYGEVVAIETDKGEIFIKKIEPGSVAGTLHLISFNGPTLHDIRYKWIGQIAAIIPYPEIDG